MIVALILIAETARADFYFEGGLSAELPHNYTMPVTIANSFQTNVNGIPIAISFYERNVSYSLYDRALEKNPYGDFVIGYDWRFKKISIDAQLTHQSSIPAGDRGQESIRLSVRWYPFH